MYVCMYVYNVPTIFLICKVLLNLDKFGYERI